MVLPGATHAVPDSHASTVGGLGALAFGCGTTELAHILATQVIAMKRPKSMRITLDGTLGPHVTAKDVALKIIAALGMAGGRGHVVEYAGNVVRTMAMEGRMTLCNLNIEMGGRSGFVAPDEGTFNWIAGRPFAPQGAQWDRALAHWRTLKTDDDATLRHRAHDRLRGARAADHLGHRSEPGGRHLRPRARPGVRSEPARDHRRRARLYGAHAGHAARGPADQPRVHRLLHQCPAARPRGRGRRGARPAHRRRRDRAGGAGLVVGEARGRGARASTRCSATPVSPGANPAARCAPAATATAASRASASSRPPTAISRTARARRRARILPVPRLPRRARSPAASPTCAAWEPPDAAVHQAHRRRGAAAQGRHQHRPGRAGAGDARAQAGLQGAAVHACEAARRRQRGPGLRAQPAAVPQSRHSGHRQQFRRRLFARGGGVGDARQQHPRDRGAQLRRHLSRELPAERSAAGGAGRRPTWQPSSSA